MQPNNSSREPVNLNTAIKIRSIEEELRQISTEVEWQFNLGKLKAKYTTALREADIAGGRTPDEDKIAAATEIYFSRLNTFQEPSRNFQVKLAEAYVARERLGRKYGIPTLFAMGAAATIWLSSIRINAIYQATLERRVETSVEIVFKQSNVLESELAKVSGNTAIISQLPESEKVRVQEDVRSAQGNLGEVKSFLGEFCPKGSAKEKVTPENYSAVNNKVVGYESRLASAQSELNGAKGIIQTQEQFTDVKRSLDSLIAEVKIMKPIKVFGARAEATYNSGISCVANRQLAEANRHSESLLAIKQDICTFEKLREEIAPVYGDIERIAKEGAVIAEAKQIYDDATQAIVEVNVPKLKHSSQALEEMDIILNQDYTVRIVSRKGVRSGIDRDYQGRFSGWYLVVEGVSSVDGEVVPVNITNSENGKKSKVTMWGERVKGNDPQIVEKIQEEDYNDSSLLVRVIRDKLDNGIVDDDIVGAKKKGYINYKLNHPEFEGKQITEW